MTEREKIIRTLTSLLEMYEIEYNKQEKIIWYLEPYLENLIREIKEQCHER